MLLLGPAAEGTLGDETGALVGSTLSSVGMRSRITPLSSEGAGWWAALVTKACRERREVKKGTCSHMTQLSSWGMDWETALVKIVCTPAVR